MTDGPGDINQEPISPFVQEKREEAKKQAADPVNESKLSPGIIEAVKTGHGIVESPSQLISPKTAVKLPTETTTPQPPTPEESLAAIEQIRAKRTSTPPTPEENASRIEELRKKLPPIKAF